MKGVAIHIGPESCAVAGNRGGEALTGVHVGSVLSREMNAPPRERRVLRGADGVPMSEGSIDRVVIARPGRTPRGQRPGACMDAPRTGTGRSHARLRKERPQAAKETLRG
jgi:hypothetical protein